MALTIYLKFIVISLKNKFQKSLLFIYLHCNKPNYNLYLLLGWLTILLLDGELKRSLQIIQNSFTHAFT